MVDSIIRCCWVLVLLLMKVLSSCGWLFFSMWIIGGMMMWMFSVVLVFRVVDVFVFLFMLVVGLNNRLSVVRKDGNKG